MTEPISEKLVGSLHFINEALLKISEKTIWSDPMIKDMPSIKKAMWLNEEGQLNSFRLSFKKLQVDEKRAAAFSMDAEYDNLGVTLADNLKKQKVLVEKEIDKIVEEKALIEGTINNTLKGLEVSPIHKKESMKHI